MHLIDAKCNNRIITSLFHFASTLATQNVIKKSKCNNNYIITKRAATVHGDLCKHLGIDSSTDHPDRYSNLFLNASSTDHPDRYSNLFLNAYINRHVHAEYLKMIQFYSPLGIWHVFLHNINTNIYHFRFMKYRQYV